MKKRMKMKKIFLSLAFMAAFMLTATDSHAQSWADLLNKDNISKVVNAITGNTASIDMTGTWSYQGSAVEFESDNLLMKAGGAAAATMAESKLNEQLSKIGIKEGQMSFTFNADSTFTSTKKETEWYLLLQCFYQTGRLEIPEIAEPARKSELYFQLTGTTVQLGQVAETDGFYRQQEQQHRTENSQFTGRQL